MCYPVDEGRPSVHARRNGCAKVPRDFRTMRGAVSAMQLVLVVVVLAGVAAAAWWYLGQSGKLPALALPGPVAPVAPGTASSPAPAAPEDLTVDQLYKAARGAMGENRMVAPAGNNALEYYLAIMTQQPDDSGAKDALRELFPFATGSAEDQINQGNFDEATRIMNLLAKADPSNYTLTILRSKLDAKRKQADREQQQAQLAATAAARSQAPAAATGTTPASEAGAAPTPATASEVAAASTTAPKAAVAQPPAPAPAPTVAATPPAPAPVDAGGESRDARVVTPPRPSYPPAAARNRQDGWVEVEFTIAADGSVQNAHVVNSNPSKVFDREAVRAIELAKFEPRLDKGEPVASTLRRRIQFKLSE